MGRRPVLKVKVITKKVVRMDDRDLLDAVADGKYDLIICEQQGVDFERPKPGVTYCHIHCKDSSVAEKVKNVRGFSRLTEMTHQPKYPIFYSERTAEDVLRAILNDAGVELEMG